MTAVCCLCKSDVPFVRSVMAFTASHSHYNCASHVEIIAYFIHCYTLNLLSFPLHFAVFASF